jgi:hypothetical protein
MICCALSLIVHVMCHVMNLPPPPNSPVCGENMFNSTSSAHFLSCGHAMHGTCLLEYQKNGFSTCPLCKKSLTAPDRRNDLWIRNYLRTNPMPPEYSDWVASVLCNDCLGKTKKLWHWQFNQVLSLLTLLVLNITSSLCSILVANQSYQ